MPAVQETIEQVKAIDVDKYKYGFETDIESEKAPKGLNEDIVRYISAKNDEPEWLTEWRLEAFRRWKTLAEPDWARVHYPKIDYQDLYYYSAPKSMSGPNSLDEIDPEILATYEKLGIPLKEQEILAGVRKQGEPSQQEIDGVEYASGKVAVDAIFDSVSIVTTFKEELAKAGVIFMPISEAVREHPDLVRKYLGSVVPVTDNFFATLNSAVYSDGSFVYIPKGVRCPMELSTYFRINEPNTGQFERTLIIADEGSYVSYLEGCTAPMRDENQLHAAVVELIALDDAEIKYSTVQNWYPGDKDGKGGVYNFVTKRGDCRGKNAKISWTQVETGFGRRVLFHRHFQWPPAGRFRHQDDPPGQEHQKPDHLQGHFRRRFFQHLSWPGLGQSPGVRRAQLHPMRFAADWRPVRRPHHSLY
jgi:Fe-S cluster assembly protein SufB